jgi:uncharacterized protein YggE
MKDALAVMVVIGLLATAVPALGQVEFMGGARSSLTAQGMEKVEVTPDMMGMRLRLESVAPEFDAALADMQAKVESVRKALETVGDSKPEITLDGPLMQGDTSEQMERMMRGARSRFGEETAEADAKPKPVKLATDLNAEWPLTAQDPIEKMRAAYAIEKAVRDAIPKSEPEKKEMTEEEEEMALMYSQNQEGPQAGTPVFYYTARLSSDGMKAAQAKALAKAKNDAAQLAETAGVKLGAMTHLSASVANVYSAEDYSNYAMQRWLGAMSSGGMTQGDPKALSLTLSKTSFNVNVTVSYELATER